MHILWRPKVYTFVMIIFLTIKWSFEMGFLYITIHCMKNKNMLNSCWIINRIDITSDFQFTAKESMKRMQILILWSYYLFMLYVVWTRYPVFHSIPYPVSHVYGLSLSIDVVIIISECKILLYWIIFNAFLLYSSEMIKKCCSSLFSYRNQKRPVNI